MFRIDQILSATTFIRCFRQVSQRLASRLEPLLVAQKNGRFLVVMDGEFFEGLLAAQEAALSASGMLEQRGRSDLEQPNIGHPAELRH